MADDSENFDARAFLLSADEWKQTLLNAGWQQSPAVDDDGFFSVRKDYCGELGWNIYFWVETAGTDFGEVQKKEKPVAVFVYGPNGARLGRLQVEPEDVLPMVAKIEKAIDLSLPYDQVVDRLLPVLRVQEGEEFDARAYLYDDELVELLVNLGYLYAGGRSYTKEIVTPQMRARIYWEGLPEESRHEQPPTHYGDVLIELRPTDYFSPRWHKLYASGNFRTVLYHVFDSDPPLDTVRYIDSAITAFAGDVPEVEAEATAFFTQLKSELIELTDRASAARRRVESIVDSLLEAQYERSG